MSKCIEQVVIIWYNVHLRCIREGVRKRDSFLNQIGKLDKVGSRSKEGVRGVTEEYKKEIKTKPS